jgi:hemerythrin-like domain-containing protein
MLTPITIIKDEHRALASVLSGLLHLIEQIRGGQAPDFPLMTSILNYIQAFPDKLHHPKEDDYLYRILRERDPGAAATLDELQDEHQRGPDTMRALVQALQAYERAPEAFEAFAQAVSGYAQHQWAHMRTEEEVILPRAEKALLASDWAEIEAAFKSNADPLVGVGTQREFRDLFRQVVNLMPAPLGLGPERR